MQKLSGVIGLGPCYTFHVGDKGKKKERKSKSVIEKERKKHDAPEMTSILTLTPWLHTQKLLKLYVHDVEQQVNGQEKKK